MNITGKKNLQKGEAVIYYPELHWMFLIKPILFFAVIFALLLTRSITAGYFSSIGFLAIVGAVYKIVLTVIFALSALYLLWKIIEFYLVQYTITNKRLILKEGLFTSTLVDLPIDRVESLVCVQSILGTVFGYGTIRVSGVGGKSPRYTTIRKPHKVRRIIYDIIERNKKITITREDSPRPVPVLVKQAQKKPEIQYGTFITSYPAGGGA
jgi:membrane protein YdbS with pleckstrin-like domain